MSFPTRCALTASTRDPPGIELPVALAHIDRIDSTKPYQRRNVRLILEALNELKSNSSTDEVPLQYLGNIKKTFKKNVAHNKAVIMAGPARTKRWYDKVGGSTKTDVEDSSQQMVDDLESVIEIISAEDGE